MKIHLDRDPLRLRLAGFLGETWFRALDRFRDSDSHRACRVDARWPRTNSGSMGWTDSTATARSDAAQELRSHSNASKSFQTPDRRAVRLRRT